MPSVYAQFPIVSLVPLETNTPALDVITMTNVITPVAAFDDTTQERLNGQFQVPPTITSGNVTFRVYGVTKTVSASKNVQFSIEHSAVAHDEDIDSATYTAKDSGDKATINTQNDLEVHSWTETVATLGWVANDDVFFKLSRKDASSNDLSGDYYILLFTIEIPVA